MSAANIEAFKRQRITWAAYGLVGYFAYLETVLGPVMPFVREEQGLSFTAASLHFSAFATGAVVTGAFGDRITGSLGRRSVLWGGALGMGAGAVGLFVGTTAAVTIVSCLLMGFCGSMTLVTTQAVLSDKHGPWSAVALTESNVVASGFAIAASASVGAFAGAGLGWRAAALPALATLAILIMLFRDAQTGDVRVSHRGDDASSLPLAFWAYWLVLFLGVAAEWSVAYWGATFLTSAADLSPASAASAMAIFFGAMLAGRIVSSRLARRVNGLTLLLGTLTVAAAGFLPLWLAPTRAVTLAGLALVGLGLSSVYPVGVSVAVATAPEASDTAAARLSIAGGAAILLAPLLIGGIADETGIVQAYGVVGLLLLAGLGIVSMTGRVVQARG